MMVKDLAGGQIAVVKNAGKMVHAFTQWAEPGSSCDSKAFVTCLQGEKNPDFIKPMRDFQHAFKSDCAKKTDCEMRTWKENRPFALAVGKHAKKAERAFEHMADEMHDDLMKEMMSQVDNAHHVMKDFLGEARERYTAWGCDAKCTDEHTEHIW